LVPTRASEAAMSTREKVRAEIDQLDERQLVELYRHLRGVVEAVQPKDQANGHIEAEAGPWQRLQEIVIDAPAGLSADLERSRHGS
jgi:hypothetical protein